MHNHQRSRDACRRCEEILVTVSFPLSHPLTSLTHTISGTRTAVAKRFFFGAAAAPVGEVESATPPSSVAARVMSTPSVETLAANPPKAALPIVPGDVAFFPNP